MYYEVECIYEVVNVTIVVIVECMRLLTIVVIAEIVIGVRVYVYMCAKLSTNTLAKCTHI